MGCVGSVDQVVNPAHINITHFSVERVVGKGGFGKVNACIYKKTGQWYAMKALSKEEVIKTQNSEMIMNERNLLVDLQNAFLVNMFYAFQDEQYCYLVMDLCMGGDLRYQLKHAPKHQFSEEQSRFYIATLICALEYIHSHKVVHRDVKPDNMLLDVSGYARLTDFGISERMDPEENCHSGSGTRAYMAPEILRQNHIHNFTVDIYAVGIVAFEFINGHWPFPFTGSSTDAELDLSPDEPINSQTQMTEESKDFVKQCLQIDPKDRIGATTGISVLKDHPWFNGFDWNTFMDKKMEAPFIPNVKQANCDTGKADLGDAFGVDENDRPKILPESQELFKGYNYNTYVDLEKEAVEAEIRRKMEEEENSKRDA